MLFTSIKPMLAGSGDEPFDDDDYLFEPKWDGGRILLHKQGERIEAYTRDGQLVTAKFPELKEVAQSIKAHAVILDCEGIVLRSGRPGFDDFAYRGRISLTAKIKQAVHTHPAVFVAFDILLAEKECWKEPLSERKKRLSAVVDTSSSLMATMFVEGQGTILSSLMKARNMEGIVAKRKDSKYIQDTVSADWLKMKHDKTIDVMILGYREEPFSLVIGLHFRTVKNKPVGVVSDGFSQADKNLILSLSKELHTVKEANTQWIRPELCCRIDYRDRTDKHQLRMTVFRGLLQDKRAKECVWES
ncbi:ATP-dependent DNA ligase [Paenibacillus alba]|uniref:DNA ligase (ATP) n=1 Tax=Paenibacillus alba TaxID=1197127 RepID=A0ABU6G4C3_9BACL|nr:DNA ligase [Paenibacillus alba]MEC0229023.1 DNA ligase [Paenibacillus alba]